MHKNRFKAAVKKKAFQIAPSLMQSIRSYKVRRKYNKSYWVKFVDHLYKKTHELETISYNEILKSDFENHTQNGHYRVNHAILEINNSCNINCLMCNTRLATRKISLMDDQLLEEVVIKLKQVGCNTFSLHTIGDPLANPKLENVFKILSKHDAKASITTNGLLMHRYKDMLKNYMDVCSAVRFSIDGVTKETYEKIRAGGKWETLLESLDTAVNELKPIGFYITITMVVSNDNFHEIGDYIVKFRDYVDFPHLDLSFGLINSLSPDNSYFNEVKLFDKFIYKKNPCGFVSNPMPYVHVDGKVSVCCRDYDGSLQVGDLRSTEIKEILTKSDKLNQLKECHKTGKLDQYNLCDTCYVVDSRLNGIFGNFIKFIIYTYPNETAVFYQDYFNRFKEIFSETEDCSHQFDKLMQSIQ